MTKSETKFELSTEQKLELANWLISKMVVTDPDLHEQDAIVRFPNFLFSFGKPEELDNPQACLWQAYQEEKLFPTSYHKQKEFEKLCNELKLGKEKHAEA